MAESAFCSSCGKSVKARGFCPVCGAKVAEAPSVSRTCVGCGAEPETPTDAFCAQCGQQFPALAIRQCSCGSPLATDFKYCVVCGAAAVPVAAPPMRSAPVPRAQPVQTKPKMSLLFAGGALLIVGLVGLAIGGFRQMAGMGLVGGYQSSPKTLTDDKTDVWKLAAEEEKKSDAELAAAVKAGGEAK